jgi:phosphoribosylamine---glycine ligase
MGVGVMNVLLLGSGGREHALAWKLAQSRMLTKLYCAPGNPGIAKHAECVDIDIKDHRAVTDFCKGNNIEFVVVGPEAPLVAGIVDDLNTAGISAFGPSKYAAQLEGSKGFTKDICRDNNIPTAAYERFDTEAPAFAYLRKHGAPIVIKADGLAAGKGVTVAMSLDEAEAAVKDIFSGKFGGASCVIEEFLEGEEASFFVLSDGETILPLITAQDHKRVGEGDTGPNTGGMGAYAPAPCMTDPLVEETLERIVEPTIRAMAALGHPYKGVLYAGLILTKDGPKLIEYNARFGDPETQVIMMLLDDNDGDDWDLLLMLIACAEGGLEALKIRFKNESALTVVMAARGYPGDFTKGSQINNLDKTITSNVEVFHAGTAIKNGYLVSNGGRVLNVTATGPSIKDAQHAAYAAVNKIDFPDSFCRKDIGWRAIT